MPTLAATRRRSPRTVNGASSASRRRAAAALAASSPAGAASTMPNSSPPSRATVSPGRRVAVRRSADVAQQHVAGLVAERVVELLEVVEVHDQHRERQAASGRGLDRLVEPQREEPPVRERGQVVRERHLPRVGELAQVTERQGGPYHGRQDGRGRQDAARASRSSRSGRRRAGRWLRVRTRPAAAPPTSRRARSGGSGRHGRPCGEREQRHARHVEEVGEQARVRGSTRRSGAGRCSRPRRARGSRAPRSAQPRSTCQPRSARMPTTSAASSRSPTGYARFVATAVVEPAAEPKTGSNTSAAPSAAMASPAMAPSSHTPAGSRRSRRASHTNPM